MNTITTKQGTYQLTPCADDGRYVDIDFEGRFLEARILRADAEQWIADREALIAARETKRAAYAAQGMEIVRVRATGAARYRRMWLVAVMRDGEEIARYNSIDEVPEIEAPATDEQAEQVAEAVAQAVRPAEYRISETLRATEEHRHDGYTLTDDGHTQTYDNA